MTLKTIASIASLASVLVCTAAEMPFIDMLKPDKILVDGVEDSAGRVEIWESNRSLRQHASVNVSGEAPVSGERPMQFSVTGLPTGAKFDATRGFITGAVAERGEYKINFTAENDKGSASRELKLVVGDKIALTPQMGWCSWNCFATAVTAKNLRDMADAFITTGLADHGWSYVNVDDFWQNNPYRGNKDPTLAGPERTADGTIVPNSRFPDMKGLADYIHSLGLRAGLYSSPGPHTCGGCTGSLGHEWRDAKTYADWGFDYLKHDWCSYEGVKNKAAQGAPKEGNVKNILPYFIMGEALAAQNRDIHYALCWSGRACRGRMGGRASPRAVALAGTFQSARRQRPFSPCVGGVVLA